MKCPNCEFETETASLKCGECGQAFDRHMLETLGHVEYMLAWLDEQEPTLGKSVHAQLREDVLEKRRILRTALNIPEKPVRPVEEIIQELGFINAVRGPQTYTWVREAGLGVLIGKQVDELLTKRIRQLETELGDRQAEKYSPTRIEVLDFTLESFPVWADSLGIPTSKIQSLIMRLEEQRSSWLQATKHHLNMTKAVLARVDLWYKQGAIKVPALLLNGLTAQELQIRNELAGHPFESTRPSEMDVVDFATDSLRDWREKRYLNEKDYETLGVFLITKYQELAQPRRAVPVASAATTTVSPTVTPVRPAREQIAPAKRPVPTPATKRPSPEIAPKVSPPPVVKPREPLVKWDKVWDKVVEAAVSGALLRWLRYLGAFLFVVSLAIVVVSFWESIPQIGQVVIIFFVPTLFYGGGWFVRVRAKIEQAGGVLMGVGAMLLAVDFAAIYQFGGLTVPLSYYWLATSLVCTTLYILTTWKVLPTEFFGYISLAGVISTAVALVRVVGLPLEWQLTTLVVLSLPAIEIATRLERASDRWADLVYAFRRLPQILMPLVLGALFFVPGENVMAAQAVAFAFATVSYGYFAWCFPNRVYPHASAWGGVLTSGLVLRAADIPLEWYASFGVILSPIYMVINKWLEATIPTSDEARKHIPASVKMVGFGVLGLGILLGLGMILSNAWASVMALGLATLVFGGYAYFLAEPLYTLAAGGLGVFPLSIGVVDRLLNAGIIQWGDWLMVSWAGLALLYLGIVVALRKAPAYGKWFGIIAHSLVPLSALGQGIFWAAVEDWQPAPRLFGVGGILLDYAVSFILHDSEKHPAVDNLTNWLPENLKPAAFLWPVGLLIPVWMAIAWWGSILVPEWLGVGLAILGLAYIGAGQLLNQRKTGYRFPFHLYGVALTVVSTVVAFDNQAALMTALYINTAIFACLAVIYQRALGVIVAGMLFLWPFTLSLILLPITPHGYALAYTLVAGLGYVPLGIWLQRRLSWPEGEKPHLPILTMGYALSITALIWSLSGRFVMFPVDVPWVGVVVPLLTTGIYGFSWFWFQHFGFAWATVVTLTFAYGKAIMLIGIPPSYGTAAWITLAYAYMLTARMKPVFASKPGLLQDWLSAFRLPFETGATVLAVSGLVLTMPTTLKAFFQGQETHLYPTILAQGLAVGLVVLAARMYRTHWLMYLEPLLAFFPVTLLFITSSEGMFGGALTTAHYGLVWSGLGLLHVAAALLLDRRRSSYEDRAVPYSFGVHLGGYALVTFGALWTWALDDRSTLLWTFGAWVLLMGVSSFLTHHKQHLTWENLVKFVVGDREDALRDNFRNIFLWLCAWATPIWVVLLLIELGIVPGFQWLGFGVTAIVLTALGLLLKRINRTYIWPLNLAAHFYTFLGLVISAPFTIRILSGTYDFPAERLTSLGFTLIQSFGVLFYVLASWVSRNRRIGYLYPYIASGLAFLPYTLGWITFGERLLGAPLTQAQFGVAWTGLAFAVLAVAVALDVYRRRMVEATGETQKRYFAHGPYFVGYSLAIFAFLWTLFQWTTETQPFLAWTMGGWVMIALLSALLVHFDLHITWEDWLGVLFGPTQSTVRAAVRDGFIWFATWLFPAWLTILLAELNVLQAFIYLAFGVPAICYLGLALWLRRYRRSYAWPLIIVGHFYTVFGLVISAPFSIRTLSGAYDFPAENLTALGFSLLQTLGVVFYAFAAWVSRSRRIGYLFPYIASGLAFLPYTLGWITFGERLLGAPLIQAQFGVAWTGLACVILAIAVALDVYRRRMVETNVETQKRYFAHGPYFVGYSLAIFAFLWTLFQWTTETQPFLAWTMGGWVMIALVSALLVHFDLHITWEEWLGVLFGRIQSTPRTVVHDVFIWFAAWLFPAWLTILLAELNVLQAFIYLAFGVPALCYLGLTLWLRRYRRSYAWPLISVGHFYTTVGLVISAGMSWRTLSGWMPQGIDKFQVLGFVFLQTIAVVFYGISSWMNGQNKVLSRLFSYIASILAFVPYTLAFLTLGPETLGFRLAYAWVALAVLLLVLGFSLDRFERLKKTHVGFAHGPYLAGYLVAGYALFWSAPDPLVNIYVLASGIGLALFSHILVHNKRHVSFLELLDFIWRKGETVQKRVVHSGFLFMAVYGFPVWLILVLAYNQVSLSWRGLALALVAPVYISFGLSVRRIREEYAWPFYSAGYLLTAIGAMVSFENRLLATYVLGLNAVVYMASAYIFQQAFWLYLSNILVPVVALLAIQNRFDGLPAYWVGGVFMALAFIYLAIGQFLDRKEATLKGISPYALPFYGLGYILSAVSLAVASVDRTLAIFLYLAGVFIYAISGWIFREPVFLYPAVWLSAVPYYLVLTLTRMHPDWYGIGWLPLIVASILVGRFIFHRGRYARLWGDGLVNFLTHPAMPFYVLGYVLSLSMMFIGRGDMTALAVALGVAAALYLGSSLLFWRAVWIYPGLLAAHIALLTYFAIDPSGAPAYYISLPFHFLSWVLALAGAFINRHGRKGALAQLITFSWGHPFLAFAALDVIAWQVVALFGWDTGIIVTTGNALLLGVLSMVWLDRWLIYGSLSFVILSIGLRLFSADLPLAIMMAIAAGVGFGFYLVSRIVEDLEARLSSSGNLKGLTSALSIWSKPLTRLGIGLNTLGMIATLPFILTHTSASAMALAASGALYLALAYRGRYYRLGYLGMAFLEVAFVLVLVMRDIRQPQWYAIPAGLYLVGVGYFEFKRDRKRFGLLVEGLGLAVLLLTSFIQSLDQETGFWYFLLLLVEGFLAVAWGTQQRRKLPFLSGLGASGINVIGQIVVLFLGGSTLIRWLIFGGVGLLLLLGTLFAERLILPQAQVLRERLSEWE